MQFVVEDVPDLSIPADTVLKARLQELELHEFSWTDKKTGEPREGSILKWIFEVTDQHAGGGKWVGRKVRGETDSTISNHPNNKFRRWAEVLLGIDLSFGFEFESDDLIGLPCEIQVAREPDRKDPGKTYERVAQVLPTVTSVDDIPF